MFQTTLQKALKAADKILINGVEVTKHAFLNASDSCSTYILRLPPMNGICHAPVFFRDQMIFVDQSSRAKAYAEQGDMNFVVLFQFLKCRQSICVEDCL